VNLDEAFGPSPGKGEGGEYPWRDFPVGSKAKVRASAPLILVADDDPRVREILAKLLRLEGYEVVLEADGKGALEAVPLLRPDLVLLDVVMPGMNGEKVCKALKGNPETRLVPILLLSGLMDVHDRVRGLEAGADDFLCKPPDRLELLARVRALLRQKSFTDRLVSAESVVLSLARSIEGKDPYTEGHCERLASYGSQLAVHMGLDRGLVEAVAQGGILHDIGKVAVPDAVLLKDGPLSEEDWALMKKHPITGEHICGPVHSFRDVLPIIRHHHEKWDGSGYPDGLAGEEIPLSARVLQTVDIYDALTTARPYKSAMTPGAALSTMLEEVGRGWWDPNCFSAFEEMVLADPDAFLGPAETDSATCIRSA
jgi:putative two-component system response regulator